MPRLGPRLGLSVERAARLGHVATGVTYVAVGVVAFLAAFDSRSQAMGSEGALRYLLGGEVGRIGLKGIADRVGWTISGVVHLGLAISAAKLALDVPQPSAERQAQAATATVMTDPVGQFGLVVAGTVIVVVAIQILYRAYIGDLDRWLELQSLHRLLRTTVVALGRFGLAARGVVFFAGGTILIEAAIQRHPWRVRALGGTLQTIGNASLGPPLLAIVALGFVAFGAIELLSASYRRINIQ